MAYFQVLKTETEKTIIKREQFRDSEGNNQTRELYETIEVKPAAYGHEDIHVGDVLEITGHLEKKAANNKEFFKKVKKTEDAKQPMPPKIHPERHSEEWLQERQQFRRL